MHAFDLTVPEPAVTRPQSFDVWVRPLVASRRRSWQRGYRAAMVLVDGLAAAAAVALADTVGFGAEQAPLVAPSWTVEYEHLALVLAPLWALAVAVGGGYDAKLIGTGSEEYRHVFASAVRFFALVAALSFAADAELARGYLVVLLMFLASSTLVARYLLRQALHTQRTRGRFADRVLVVGSRDRATELVRHLRRVPYSGLRVIGASVPGPAPLLVDGEAVPVVCQPTDLYDAVEATGAQVVAATDTECLPDGTLRALAWHLEGSGVDLVVAPAVTDVAGPRISIRPVAGLPLLHVEEPSLGGPAALAKGAVDRVLAAVVLALLTPLLVVVAFAIRLSTRGPALFRQERVGRNGSRFTILKFRTMYQDAEQRLDELERLNEYDQVLFKIRRDPRVTPVGRWLRRFSLDELPQLWNVVRGEMSLVGPRPPIPSEVANYHRAASRRLLVKPGLTGLWQVSGRSDLSWDETVRLDLYYVENWSPALDVMIAWKTLRAVLGGRGAY